MTYWQRRQQAQRLRAIALENLLPLCGARRDQDDKHKWHTPQGVLSVSGPKFMNWNCGRGGGGAIDLVMHLNHLDFKAAVDWLAQHFPGVHPPQSAATTTGPACAQPRSQFAGTSQPCYGGRVALQPVVASTPRLALRLPPPDPGKLQRVRQYLVHQRAIAPALLEPLIQAGTLYADARANAVFLLLGKENLPVGAELRGTTARTWRGLATGSQKDLGCFAVPVQRSLNSQNAANPIILCESAIDALSCFALHPQCRCLSTAGARPNPHWLQSLLDQGDPIYCGFDADLTGDNMAATMIASYPVIKRLRPPAHDWNDVLKLEHR